MLLRGLITLKLEIVITRAAPAFHNLFMVMGCVFDINTVHHKTVEKLGRTQNAEPYSMEYPMEYLEWSTPKNHVLVK